MRHTAALALLSALVATPSFAGERRIAVLVGNDSSGGAREPLRWAARDAREMESVLAALAAVKRTHLLVDQGPDALRAAWTRVERELASDPEPAMLFFFYSGHADDRGLLMEGGRYPFDELRRTLEALHVRLFVAVIDACQSGALSRVKGGSAVPVLDLDIRDANRTQEGGIYITSGASGEAAQESDEIQGSFFTHYLVSGLRGAADDSGDRRVSLEEAYRFAYVQTLARTRATLLGVQHPSWEVDVKGQGQLVLTWLDEARSWLLLPPSASGRWYVRGTRTADVFAETDKRAGTSVRIAVEPGSYEVARADGDTERFGMISVAAGEEVVVDDGGFSTRQLVRQTAKGGAATGAFTGAYRLSAGYLADATPIHAARLSYALPLEGVELAFVAHYGESRWTRAGGLEVALREIGAGVSATHRRAAGGPLSVFGGAELLFTYARQTAEDTGLDAVVVPLAGFAGAGIDLAGGLSVEAAGSLGAVFLRGTDGGVRASLQPGFTLGVRYAP